MHKIIYNCRLCGRRGIATASELCPPEQIDIFAKGLCCNPCFDAREKKTKLEAKLMRAAQGVVMANYATVDETDGAKRAGAIEAQKLRETARKVFDRFTREWCEAVCELHLVQFTYSDELPDLLYQKAERAGILLEQYESQIISLKAKR